ncbi:MAG: hypothetical protein ACR2GG_10310 [Gemmatimonadaceae bacterium]
MMTGVVIEPVNLTVNAWFDYVSPGTTLASFVEVLAGGPRRIANPALFDSVFPEPGDTLELAHFVRTGEMTRADHSNERGKRDVLADEDTLFSTVTSYIVLQMHRPEVAFPSSPFTGLLDA